MTVTTTSTRINPTAGLVFVFVALYIHDHGYPPVQREIATGCSLSMSGARHALLRLYDAGYLDMRYHRTRGLRLTGKVLS